VRDLLVGHTYTSIGNILHTIYQKFFLGYELRHPEDVNRQACFVCGDMENSGEMIECERWGRDFLSCHATHPTCKRDPNCCPTNCIGECFIPSHPSSVGQLARN
jgi:hypothetical protein